MSALDCKRLSASSFGTKRHLPVAACLSRVSISRPLFAGIEIHEDADLLDAGSVAADIAQVVEQHVAKRRQGQRDADDEQRQQGIERRRPQPAKSQGQRSTMLGQPTFHETSLPWSRRNTFGW
ncbi:MAG: hypothetical protein HT580_12735 [Dechloromonas sp.]|nr:MAG: hypothetical protein HT580_12735 [Dechloromonas sp.]